MNTIAELSARQQIRKQKGKNFDCLHAGAFAALHQYELEHPKIPRTVSGKLFLKDHLGLNSVQISLNKLPAGVEVPFYHKHKSNEEVYIFVGGRGQLQVDSEIIDVEEGSCVRISPEGVRTWRNNSTQDLYYIVIQGQENSLRSDTFEDGVPVEKPVSW